VPPVCVFSGPSPFHLRVEPLVQALSPRNEAMVRRAAAFLAPLALALKMKEDALCHDWSCGKGYAAKIGHHEIAGKSNSECCDKTCELFMCGPGYVENEAYHSNVAQSNQQCCDQACSTEVECAEGWSLIPEKLGKPGKGAEDCCAPSCARYSCPADYKLKVDAGKIFANDTEKCCTPMCGAFQCPKGYKPDPSQKDVLGSTPEECCMQECALFDHLCPKDTGVPPESRCKLGRSTKQCCEKKCSLHRCSAGFALNKSSLDEFGDTDKACCMPTCAVFDCPLDDGWVNASLKSGKVGSDPETCCAPACSRYNCSAGWVSDPKAEDKAETGDLGCCAQTCMLHNCTAGVKKPNISSAVGSSDQECCEPPRCSYLREKKLVATDGCQHISEKGQETCEKHYYAYKDSHNRTAAVECFFDLKSKLCRNGGKLSTNCALPTLK